MHNRKITGSILVLLLSLMLFLSACGDRSFIAYSNASQETSGSNERDDSAPEVPTDESGDNELDEDTQDASPEDDDNEIDEDTPKAPVETPPETPPEATSEEPPEESPEVSPEESPDVTPEVSPEMSPDVTPEEPSDVTPDASPDAEEKGESISDEIIEIKVSTAEEFVAALGSNRRILLEEGVYNLTNISPFYVSDYNGEAIYYGEVFDGFHLVLVDVNNLSIIGIGDMPSELVVEPRYASVLYFSGCSNISISNIKAGHIDKDGFCYGAVFSFMNSEGIRIDDTLMYGCGAYGLQMSGVKDMSVFSSTIYECTYGSMWLIDDNLDILFKDCEFRDNSGFSTVEITRGPFSITFDSCTFRNNRCLPEGDSISWLHPLINIMDANIMDANYEANYEANLTIKNSLFVDNTANMFINPNTYAVDASNTFENNTFVKVAVKP